MKLLLYKPDTIGVIASTLCVIHCLATPLLFIAQSCSVGGCESTPFWWRNIDYLFLVISFISVYRTTQTTSRRIMKPAFWLSWVFLVFLIVNEKLTWFSLPEVTTYLIAFTLVGLHLYNLTYCQCKMDKCCMKNG